MASNSAILEATSTTFRARAGGVRASRYKANGNGVATVFNIAHGAGGTPVTPAWTKPQTAASRAAATVTSDATNIIVTFTAAPPVGVDNVDFQWAVSRYGAGIGWL